MPSAWSHATLDLICWGRSYFDLHKRKDKPYETLGPKHRTINHNWYQKFERSWTFLDPFPIALVQLFQTMRESLGAELTELEMVSVTHDYFDKIWDILSPKERKYVEGFLFFILQKPTILENWASVDVICGRIHRTIGNREVWEHCPGLSHEYNRLSKYVDAVLCNDKSLQDMIELYG